MEENRDTAVRQIDISPEIKQILSESPEQYFENWAEEEERILELQIKVETQREKRSRLRELLLTLFLCMVVSLVTAAFLQYVIRPIKILGPSMMDTLQDGDIVLLNKVTTRFLEPQRYDIIVFRPDTGRFSEYGVRMEEENVSFVKRIIGLPGEVVYIDPDGRIHIAESFCDGEFINDYVLEENFGKEEITNCERLHYATEDNPAILGEDEYFVMGDNRNNSTDSRKVYVGPIRRSQIEGIVIFRLFPLKGFGKLE